MTLRRAAALLCCFLLSCSGGEGDGTTCSGDDGGALDCSTMCKKYCDKLSECGVSASDSCVDDCRTVTEAGSSTSSYTCVIKAECSDISACGI